MIDQPKVITRFSTLLHLARSLAKAEKSGDPKTIKTAKKAHDEYVALCKSCDGMIIPR